VSFQVPVAGFQRVYKNPLAAGSWKLRYWLYQVRSPGAGNEDLSIA